jgi:serine/threonine-protein kinase
VGPEDLIGYTLPSGFQIRRHIATGGFAWVFEALTPERARCAVKIPHQSHEHGLKRFVREIKVMRELPRSPHCVQYLGDGRLPDGRPYVAMELIDGRTLARVLEPGTPWEPWAACAIGTQLCAALRGMHKLGLANRDVSPNNVMLTLDNHVKLMDFGLVKDAQGLLHLLEEEDILAGHDFAENLDAGLLLGTLDYVAPEQLADSSVTDAAHTQTDTWSDVYSVGLILWQMITGKRLFELDLRGGQQRVAQRILDYMEMRTSFDETRLRRPPAMPAPLFRILVRSLRLDPKRRQRTAMELGQELSRFLETGEGTEQEDDERTEHVRLEDYLGLLAEETSEHEATAVRHASDEHSGVRMSSIPVVLDFDDEDDEKTAATNVVIPQHDPVPSTGDPELDAFLLGLDEETRRRDR